MMKNIRRSMKGGERHDSLHGPKLSHASITPKSAITITPPKKVIKAIEAYAPVSDQELGFEKGDFFHVVGNENNTEWYEACNPATGARGFVPVPYFQVMGKNERDSQDSISGRQEKRNTTDADSGYSDRGTMSVDRNSAKASARGGSPLYGVVLYDFNAERPDELEAKQDEDIIVIAQSSDSWFVAKPIGRLGGPGLIPVDFVEIRDMATGIPVEDKKAAIARAGVPKVEEWKKMAAEYKNSSIALGQFEFDDESQRTKHVSVHEESFNRNTMQSYNGGSMLNGNRSSRGIAPGTLVAPISASVDSYNFENSRYWYVMNAVMEDGRSWSLCRFYEDFYDFQIALLDEFREEAGHTGSPRKLPYMPGPVTYVTDTISAARRQSLDDYIKKLLSMEPYISKCRLVKQLFAPRPGDVEQTQYRELSAQDHRRSATSQLSSDSSREPSRQSSAHNLNGNAGGNGYPGLTAPPPRHSTGAQSRITNGTIAQAQQVHIRNATASTTTTSGQFLKIKIEYNDEMIAVRLPKDVSFAQLQDKLQERLGTVNLNTIQYRDEASGQVMDMFGDNDLTNALSRNPKLKLFIN